jgi:hypothetical protein
MLSVKDENRLFLLIYKYHNDIDKYLEETKESKTTLKNILKQTKLVKEKFDLLFKQGVDKPITEDEVTLNTLEHKLIKRLNAIVDSSTDPAKIAKALSVINSMRVSSNDNDDSENTEDKINRLNNALMDV